MRIKEISYYGANGDRCTITFEDEAVLKSFASAVISAGVYPGMEMTREEYLALKKASAAAGAKARAAAIAARAPLSRASLEKKLREKGEEPEHIKDAADWLEDIGALNDGEYAALIVRHYSAKGYGLRRIKEELRRRGIDRELWDAALEEAPEGTGFPEAFIARRLSPGEKDRAAVKKVSDALLRRGYSYEEIKSAIERYLDPSED